MEFGICFETDCFICMVKDRPCIYDPNHALYKSRRKRNQAWQEIAAKIWSGWQDFSPAVKDSKVLTLKQKWKNLKDAFLKHRKQLREHRSGLSACPPTEYIHAPLMSFLIPCLETADSQNNWDPLQGQQIEEEEDIKPQVQELDACASTSAPGQPSVPTDCPAALPRLAAATRSTQKPHPAPYRRRILLRAQRRRAEREEAHLVDRLQSIVPPIPRMSSEAHFLLSLEDKMKMVPSERQTELRTTLMSVVDSYLYLDGTATPPMH